MRGLGLNKHERLSVCFAAARLDLFGARTAGASVHDYPPLSTSLTQSGLGPCNRLDVSLVVGVRPLVVGSSHRPPTLRVWLDVALSRHRSSG